MGMSNKVLKVKSVKVINVTEFIKEWAEDSEEDGFIAQKYGQEIFNVLEWEPGNLNQLNAVKVLFERALGMVQDEIRDLS